MKTPLFHEHERLGAKMVDFHGWEMPVWYTGVREEHLAVRCSAGLFDVSHMGEILVEGTGASAFIERLTSRRAGDMEKGRVLYALLLNERGGIVDDLMISCLAPDSRYLLCVNSANRDTDLAWISAHITEDVNITDASDSCAMLALQGPGAGSVLKGCLGSDFGELKPFHLVVADTPGFGRIMVSRTGYTGAGGFEICLGVKAAPDLWRGLLGAGARPCGLGARDTLRLEMGYPLHGSDITEDTTVLEAGLEFALDMESPDFIGRQALLSQKRHGLERALRGVELTERGVPRAGCRVLKDAGVIGTVTSGSVSPTTGRGIALAYLPPSLAEGEPVAVEVRDRPLAAVVRRPPFAPATIGP